MFAEKNSILRGNIVQMKIGGKSGRGKTFRAWPHRLSNLQQKLIYIIQSNEENKI